MSDVPHVSGQDTDVPCICGQGRRAPVRTPHLPSVRPVTRAAWGPVPDVATWGRASEPLAAAILTHMPWRLLSTSLGVPVSRGAECPKEAIKLWPWASGHPFWEILFFSFVK